MGAMGCAREIRVWTVFLELPGFHMRKTDPRRHSHPRPFRHPRGNEVGAPSRTRRICLRPALLRVEARPPLMRTTLQTHPRVLFGKTPYSPHASRHTP